MVFPVVMYGCESWTIKKAECWRIDAFELWCWRRLLRVPWMARRSNQSILKEISPEYSLVGLMLKLKLPILWPPHANSWLIWKDPDAGKDWSREKGDDRGWDSWMASPTRWTWVWVNSRSWWWTGRPGIVGSQRVRHEWAAELTDLLNRRSFLGTEEKWGGEKKTKRKACSWECRSSIDPWAELKPKSALLEWGEGLGEALSGHELKWFQKQISSAQ